jgi:nucleotide-binding universal stress UspA family protein
MTPTPFARILVGYVPTEQGTDARALCVDLAAACSADLLLVSVVAAVWIEHIGEQTRPAVVHSGERERAASALKEAAAELPSVAGIGHVERRLEASSSPARGLHDTAVSEQADLIVVGSSHHGPLGRVLLGSVGERLLSGAPCAVAVAPRGYAARKPRRFGMIAVAFDGSPEARVALRAAHDLASRTGALLRAVMVIEPPAAIPGQFVPLPGLEPSRSSAQRRSSARNLRHGPHSTPRCTTSATLRRSSRRCCSAPIRQPRSSTWLAPTSTCSCSARAPTGPCGARWPAASRPLSSAMRRALCSSRRASASALIDEPPHGPATPARTSRSSNS